MTDTQWGVRWPTGDIERCITEAKARETAAVYGLSPIVVQRTVTYGPWTEQASEPTKCPTCDGHGEMHRNCSGHPHINCDSYVCTTCHGEGALSLTPCRSCGHPARSGDICDQCWSDAKADHDSQAVS